MPSQQHNYGKLPVKRILLCLAGLLIAFISPSVAHADDPSISASPQISDATLRPPIGALGSSFTSGPTGAATYKYPFSLPPTRGVKPSLALTYSSDDRFDADVASGWFITGVPSIQRDVTRERGPSDVQYVTDFDGTVQGLVPTTGLETPGFNGRPYRTRINHDFTRFEFHSGPPSDWIAQTTDGLTYYLGTGVGNSLPGYWPLTWIVDRWGNSVTYGYRGANTGAVLAEKSIRARFAMKKKVHKMT